jgi:hypothetical protein
MFLFFAYHSGGGAGQDVLVAEYWPSDSFDDRPRITYGIHPVWFFGVGTLLMSSNALFVVKVKYSRRFRIRNVSTGIS